MTQDLECIEEGTTPCEGTVEMRYPGYGHKCFARCEKHGDLRLKRESENRAKYDGPEPSDFDPAYAGETWDEEP